MVKQNSAVVDVTKEQPLVTLKITLPELNKLIKEVGCELESILNKKLPYKFDLSKEDIRETYLTIEIEALSLKVNELKFDWNKINFTVTKYKQIKLQLKLLKLALSLVISVKIPLMEKFKELVMITLDNLTVECEVSKLSAEHIFFEAKEEEY